jgi:hypothetical protein
MVKVQIECPGDEATASSDRKFDRGARRNRQDRQVSPRRIQPASLICRSLAFMTVGFIS